MAEIHALQDQTGLQSLVNGLHGEGRSSKIEQIYHAESGDWKDRAHPVQNKIMTRFDRLIGRSKFLAERKLIIKDDDDVPPREALQSGRLQQSTNHKRPLQESDLQIRQKLQRILSNQEPESSPRKRYSSEDPTAEICAQHRRGLTQGDNWRPAINNAGAMSPGKSQGTRQPPTQRTPTPESPSLLSSNAKSKQDTSIEIVDSAEDDENEGKVISARRVRQGKTLKQHRSEVDFTGPTDSVTAAGPLPSESLVAVRWLKGQGVKQHRSEVVVADAIELEEKDVKQRAILSAQDGGRTDNSQIRPKKIPLWDSWNRKSSSIPDYGDSTSQNQIRAPDIVRDRSMAPYKNGGPQPMNTLAGHGKRAPTQKAFNLTRPKDPETVTARKWEEIDRGSISSSEATKPVVESEPNRTFRNNAPGQQTAESLRSPNRADYNGNGRSASLTGRVDELRRVHDATKSKRPRKSRRPSTSDSGNGRRYLTQSTGRRLETTGGSAELAEDPIQSESGLLGNDTRPLPNGRSNLEIQIKSREFLGSTNLKRPRDNISRLQEVNGPEMSPHFAQSTISRRQKQDNRSSGAALQTTRRKSISLREDESVDEIAEDYYQDERSRQAAKRRRIARKALDPNRETTLPSVEIPRRRLSDVIAATHHSSDEDETSKRGNIPRTEFTDMKKSNLKRNIDIIECKTKQLFTQSSRSLSRGDIGLTILDRSNGTIRFDDGTGKDIPDLALKCNTIQRIIYNENSPKFVIHRPGSTHGPQKHQIHVEVADTDERRILLRAIKSKYLAIPLRHKSPDHMDRIFENIQKLHREPGSQVPREDPQDILLAKKRQQDRQQKKFESKKAIGGRIVDRIQGVEGDPPPESVTRSGKKRNRSTSEPSDDERRQNFKHSPFTASEFYSASDNKQTGATAYSTRSSARGKEPSAYENQKLRSASPERWTTANPGWEDYWHTSIIYPREGKNKATVDKEDIERLDEGAFLNDNLIEFYLRWLEARTTERNPEFAKRVYFCNTFFYVRLTQDAKGKRGINYDAVARWTSKVDLFSYDYIIVPVNESLHWYLAIICNVPRFLYPEIDLVSSSPSQRLVNDCKVEQDNADATTNSRRGDPVPFASLEQLVETSEEPVVNAKMENMSLEDEPVKVSTDVATKGSFSDKASPDPEPERGPESDTQTPQKEHQHERRASAASLEERQGSQSIDDAVPIASDLQGSPARKAARGKKGHRKSLPTPRKYSVNEPRIITLDSFGNSHSPTCTNLRDYLVAEAKAKKNRDITPPGTIGMTAKRIPIQTNYCDCGLYLLSYAEMFLEKGDEFIHSLLQNTLDESLEWRHGPEMRSHIRSLLFDIQKQQVAENERTRKEKGKAKRLVKAMTQSKPAEKVFPSLQEHTSEAPEHKNGSSSNTSVEDNKLEPESISQPSLEGAKSSNTGYHSEKDNREVVISPEVSPHLQPLGKLGGQKSVASAFGARHDPANAPQDSTPDSKSMNKEVVEIQDSPPKSDRNLGQKARFSMLKDPKAQDHIFVREGKDDLTQPGSISYASPLPGPGSDKHDTSTLSNTGSTSLRPGARSHTLSVEIDNGTSSMLHRKIPLAGLSPSDPDGVINLEEDSEASVSAGESDPKDYSMPSGTTDDTEMLLRVGSQSSRRSPPDSPVEQLGSPTTRSRTSKAQRNLSSHQSPVIEIPITTRHVANKSSPSRPKSRGSRDGATLKTSSNASTRKATRTEWAIPDTQPSSSKKRKQTGDDPDVQELAPQGVSSKKPGYARDSSDLSVVGRHQGGATSKPFGTHTRFH